jgi:hypothetical protein
MRIADCGLRNFRKEKMRKSNSVFSLRSNSVRIPEPSSENSAIRISQSAFPAFPLDLTA